jgi:hypothetical protein
LTPRLDPGDAFHKKRLILGAAPEFLIQLLAEQRRRERGNADVEWECGDHDDGQHR